MYSVFGGMVNVNIIDVIDEVVGVVVNMRVVVVIIVRFVSIYFLKW